MPWRPHTVLRTHEVHNQPPPLGDVDLLARDPALMDAIVREGAASALPRLESLSRRLGSEEVQRWGDEANRVPPRLAAFDRYGQRIDEVEFHPAYHALMQLAAEHRIATAPWTEPGPGAHVAHAAAIHLFTQIEAGVVCPIVMTYAVVPSLRQDPEIARVWLPRLFAGAYDPRAIPAGDKLGVTFGMAMTEKQGGSDVRANTTIARPDGSGRVHRLTGHKWFCSAPMSDAFLTLAQTEAGLTCFLVPRFLPDGTRNRFSLQRLKDKLGNRSNASSELEYEDTWAEQVGEAGRGIRTIMEMVQHTRLDAAVAPAGLMRQALVQAVHHGRHRKAFGRRLAEQPLMQNVLADLTLESEAATLLALRVARTFDEAPHDEGAARLSRVGTAIAKYWLNKRAPGFVAEALECLGGGGYVEESPLPRLYREAPLNGIWEGSGNVIALDVLRAVDREPQAFEAWRAEVEPAAREHRAIACGLARLDEALALRGDERELVARRIVGLAARLWQAALMTRHAAPTLADAFVATRLGEHAEAIYGTLPRGTALAAILDRALP